jgi:hypothetical protein
VPPEPLSRRPALATPLAGEQPMQSPLDFFMQHHDLLNFNTAIPVLLCSF